ncbi:SCO family protein [Desulfosediminicola sp.]|uniref:SCO family protein n=1 Tax=Desulfosediminicola sp. TaxID=2886825 RepID=UPI003AF23332
MVRSGVLYLAVILQLLSLPFVAAATAEQDEVSELPRDINREWVTEKRGEYIPLDAKFLDEHGKEVTLGEIIDRPTLILPIYFYCPSSCSVNLANMAVAMNRLSFDPGDDYKAIALSFSHTETPEIASQAKRNYLKLTFDGFPAEEWSFLTGSAEEIKRVTDSLGFRFKRIDDETFVHPSAMIAVAADGKIIRYVYGSFISGDIDIAISSAREGIPILSVRRFLEFCFNYDTSGKRAIYQNVKVAVLIFFAVVLVGVSIYYRKKRRRGGGRAR